ncbi:MAG: hypothetical protein PUD43_10040, partial [Clostridia bacterium]|nr:hypothetical protein [Clostridia bacterium]
MVKFMIRISNIKMSIDDADLTGAAAKKLKIKREAVKEIKIRRKSLDARKKNDIHYLYTVDVAVEGEEKILKSVRDKSVTLSNWSDYVPLGEGAVLKHRPVVAGFGPAGMFAALVLAERGLKPIVLERGRDVERRTEDVESFWNGGAFDPESNVQFGEGGAGTFSDGKLTTRIKDGRSRYVIQKLIEAGAPDEIAYDAKPHIGTDRLKDVVKNIRNKITALGGEVRFESRLTGFEEVNGCITAAVVNNTDRIETDSLVLAVGHSARDTFKMLCDGGVAMEQKPFAAGVRIEHLQKDIGLAQYGDAYTKLPPADYMLTYTTKEGRGVYSFCMCPGGYVVAAASEDGRLVVNGMSEYARDGENANSALLVQVSPEDFGSDDPLAGVEFQRRIEEAAYRAGGGGYAAPVQRYEDFVLGRVSQGKGKVRHTYRPNIKYADLNGVLPCFIAEALKEAIPEMGKRLKGFDSPDALMTGVETRSSSPVRIVRDKEGNSM